MSFGGGYATINFEGDINPYNRFAGSTEEVTACWLFSCRYLFGVGVRFDTIDAGAGGFHKVMGMISESSDVAFRKPRPGMFTPSAYEWFQLRERLFGVRCRDYQSALSEPPNRESAIAFCGAGLDDRGAPYDMLRNRRSH